VIESDHPLPTERSVDAGQAALDVAERARRERMPLVVLLSGGASALMCVPEAGLTVDDLRACTEALLRAGATIDELNAVRAHCDVVKGGRLAAAAAPSPVVTLILSDVIGDRLDVIGSGPTVAPGASPAEALAVLKRRKVERACRAVASHLRLRAAKPVEPPDCSRSTCRVVANNQTAVDAAAVCIRGLGFEVAEARSGVAGEARDAAFALVGAVRQARSRAKGRPVAVVWGGETTVSVKGKGRGGRNLEAALAAAIAMDGDASLVIATFATDGVDGTSDAAGAVVSGRTASLARRGGADPEDYLARSDSHAFFETAGGMLRPGPTGTNVNDVWVGLGY
jgi:hydroxypyruvate reductase